MYSLGAYGSMVADRVRVEAYAQALRKTVREGSVVVEIGTGPGIFAVLACQVGASRVYAFEPSEIIQVAREIATANGCADRIEFVEELSIRVTLPIRAEVILSDLRGVLPLFKRHIPSIVDARHRFLAPGGTLIPRRDTLWAAIVEAPKPYCELVDPWDHNPLDQDLSAARRLIVNDAQKIRVSPSQLLTAHRLWTTLDYGSVENPNVRGDLDWRVERAGTGHGILVWFDADLAENTAFSNAPTAPETIYGSLFFPWTQPVSLVSGQAVCVSLEAQLVEDDYIWRWATHIEPPEGSGASLIDIEQSQLTGEVLSAAKLHRMAADYVPQLSEEGHLRRRTFALMDGKASLEEIAHRLATEFPKRFPRWELALSYAGAISQEHSR
jgi:Arginine methyltransferase oligomerization subdomain/Ribosomal protein L11 methyltransferase (PrmA)